MYNVVITPAPSFLIGSSFIFAGNEDSHKISDEFKIDQIRPRAAQLAALEGIKNPQTYNAKN